MGNDALVATQTQQVGMMGNTGYVNRFMTLAYLCYSRDRVWKLRGL